MGVVVDAGLMQMGHWARALHAVRCRVPGTLACATIALASAFVSEHHGGPQLLYALLFGLAFHFFSEDAQIRIGVDFCSRTLLRIGVALMGARITVAQVSGLGVRVAVIVVGGVLLTITVGMALSIVLKRPREEGLLSAGAVAICGASAALAISSVLPQSRENERFTLLAVVGVTILSTMAMIIYPILAKMAHLGPVQSGVFFGSTIHDVAQVAAAGMMLSPLAGDTAIVVKLFRVLLLVPLVLILSISYRKPALGGDTPGLGRAPLVPGFLLAFAALVLVSSCGVLPIQWVRNMGDTSRWLLVTAIAAAGIKTSIQDLGKLGWLPVAMLVVESLCLSGFVLLAILPT